MKYLTDDVIDDAKTRIKSRETANHEHNDCIRIAYEWLDAQKKLKHPNPRLQVPMKHIIEGWAKRYVSESDVVAAAFLHETVIGKYPSFNISSRLVFPNPSRLVEIGEAGRHPDYSRYDDFDSYKSVEK